MAKEEKLKKELAAYLQPKEILIPTIQSQSTTEENYMDYDWRKTDKTVNDNFDRKSFYKWQWDDIRETGKLGKGNYFVEL